MSQLNPFFIYNSWILFPVLAWILFWKGCSLWIAAKNDQKGWFLALLVFNTIGILEIIYIFYVAKKKWVDIREILARNKPLIK